MTASQWLGTDRAPMIVTYGSRRLGLIAHEGIPEPPGCDAVLTAAEVQTLAALSATDRDQALEVMFAFPGARLLGVTQP